MNESRQVDDCSSYTCRSEYDPFGAGHGCSSISSGLGNVYRLLLAPVSGQNLHFFTSLQ